MPRPCPSILAGEASSCLTDEERAIVAALRSCPESELSAVCPLTAPLTLPAIAILEGMTEGTVRYLLESGMRRIAAAIGRDPELLQLVYDYYTSHQTKDND